MQQAAGRAERARASASGSAAAYVATQEAKRTRDLATAMGEELARLRVQQGGELAARWEALHQRSATRLLELCLTNGGVYVKLGQHLAQCDYIVPAPYVATLSTLFDHCTRSSPEAVASLVEEELGQPPHRLFATFDPEPIASASLAQVHKAVEIGTGKALAVKVQHPRLREASDADLAAVALAVKAATWLFPNEFRLSWVLDELAPHLPLELDFEHEARNLERCRRFFAVGGGGEALAGAVALPEVLPHLSSSRVLTMSFEDGVSITDGEGVQRMGLSKAGVSRLLSETFCALIFKGGFVHCDPHPGNLLVRPRPDRPDAPQLVLLDHGLYRELPRHFTQLYAQLWMSILLGDADGIRSVSVDLGVGNYYPLLAAMLTGRPWGEILATSNGTSRLVGKGTKEDKAQIAGYAQQYVKEIVVVLERVPPPMLLLFKCNDCLRHVERQLCAGVDSFLTTLRYCLQATLELSPAASANARAAHTAHAVPVETLGSSGNSTSPASVRHGRRRSRLKQLRLRLALWVLWALQNFERGPQVLVRLLAPSLL